MANQADAPQGDDELDETILAEQPDEGDQPEEQGDDQDDEGSEGAADEDEDEEVQIQFGDEAAPASEGEPQSRSDLVKQLRTQLREKSERIAKYERGEIPSKPQVVEVGEEPTLENCDYDESAFKERWTAWNGRKAEADKAQADAAKAQEAAQAQWLEVLQGHVNKAKALGFKDYAAAEEEVVSGLSQAQQAIVIKAADDSAKVIYALGKTPAKLATLAAIQDPIKFAVAVSKLEGTLKVTKTSRRGPEPERHPRGSAPLSPGNADKKLEALEREADRTGDRSKIVAYKRELKRAGK